MSAPAALVTGAGRGIGRACVERLLARGWRVVAGVRDPERARREIGAREGLVIVRLDVCERESVRAGVAAAEEHAGGALDCVVNNAAYAAMGAQEDADLDEIRAMFETNLFGAAAVVQAALPAMRETGRGAIVAVGSVADILPTPLVGFYNASKAGLAAMAAALAVECRPFGVRVSLVVPGMVDTDFPKATTLTGSAAEEGGVYRPLLLGLRGGFARWRAEGQVSPEVVAEAVVRAAEDPSSPFRIVVGADTEMLTRRRQSLDDDAWHDSFAEFLGLDWALPA